MFREDFRKISKGSQIVPNRLSSSPLSWFSVFIDHILYISLSSHMRFLYLLTEEESLPYEHDDIFYALGIRKKNSNQRSSSTAGF